MAPQKIFLDGVLVSADRRMLESLKPGELKGQGVFETLRAHQGKTFNLNEHLKRLFKGLKILKITAPFTKKEIRENLVLLLYLNPRTEARIRLMVWRWQGDVHAAIVVHSYRPFSPGKYHKGFKVIVAPQRLNRSIRWASVKSIQYGIFLRNYQWARKKGYDEAIFLNRRGFLSEGSRSNLFFVKGRTIFTPSLKCGCLDGITHRTVIKTARRLKLTVQEVEVKPEELFRAEEAFLTNSLMGVMPLTKVEGRAIGTGKAGPVTLQILKFYQKAAR